MRKLVKVSILLMAILTVIYTSWVVYKIGYSVGESYAREYSLVKRPTEYGIWKAYIAEEKLEREPEEWYTPDELGIVLIKCTHFEHYHIFIARENEEKALAWMRDEEFTPSAVKNGDGFYRISFLWVEPGIPEPRWEIPIGVVLGVGWVFCGALFLKGRKKE